MCIVLCTLFVACSGDDLEQYAQRADNANEIGFMTRTENVTRGYSMENPHPATMGVLGYHDLSELHMKDNEFIIFNNKKVSYEDDAWIYSPIKFWPEYASFNNFDFFGYMPYSSNATLTYYDLGYTLSFNATLSVSAPSKTTGTAASGSVPAMQSSIYCFLRESIVPSDFMSSMAADMRSHRA